MDVSDEDESTHISSQLLLVDGVGGEDPLLRSDETRGVEEEEEDDDYMDEEEFEEEERKRALQMRPVIEESSSCMWMETADKKHHRFLIISNAVERTFNFAKLREIDEDIIPVSHHPMTDTFMRTSMQVSPCKVKDFKLKTVVGSAAATRLSFLLKTFSSPSIGQPCSQTGDVTSSVLSQRGGYTCTVGGRIYPKVSLYMEVLVHDEQLPLGELYCDDNWKGYRLWFLVHDPSIDIDKCIDAQISANALSLGLVPNFQYVDTSGQQSVDVINDYFGGDVKAYRASVMQENREAARKNNEARERRRLLKEQTIEKACDHYLDIYSRLSYYNQCLVPLNCDGERRHLTLGEPIATTLEAAQRFITDPNPPEGQTGRIIMNPIFQEYLHHSTHYNVASETYIWNLLEIHGVSMKQIDNTNYFGEDTDYRDVYQLPAAAEGTDSSDWARCMTFKFPFNKLVFRFSQQHMEPEFFMELPLPWVFSPMDVELERFAQRCKEREDQEEADRQERFFDQFSESEHGANILRALEIDNAQRCAALDAVCDPITLSEKDLMLFDDKTHSYLRHRLKKPVSTNTDHDPSIISVESSIDEARRIQHARFKKLRRFWRVMTRGEQHYIMGLYQEEGTRLFLNVMTNSEQNKHTHVVEEAIKLANGLVLNGKSAYHERECVLFSMGFTASYMARELLELEHHDGMLAHHNRVHELRGRAFRAAHDHHTDRLYGTSGAIEHEMVIGAAGTGKTHSVEMATKQLLPGTIYVNNSSSACADNSGESQSDTVMAIDEMDGRFDPGARQTPQEAQQMSNIKSSMTGDFALTRSILALGDSKGMSAEESARTRRNIKICTNMHRSIQLSGNKISVGIEPSFLSRFVLSLISGDDLNRSSRSLTSSLLRAGSSGIAAVLDPVKSRLDEWRQLEHALHVLAVKKIAVGAIHYPNIEMFNVHWSNVYTAILEVLPSLADISRVSEAMISRALTECVTIAIHKVFTSEDSPLVELDTETKSINEEKFSMRHLKLIEPYLFLPEDMAIHIITQFVNEQIFPAQWYQVMEMVAVTKCQYAIQRRREKHAEAEYQKLLKANRASHAVERRSESDLRTTAELRTLQAFCPNWACTNQGGGGVTAQSIDGNYVSTGMTKDELANYIDAQTGYNKYCGRYMIDKLCTMRLRAKSLNRSSDKHKEMVMPIMKLEAVSSSFSGAVEGGDGKFSQKNFADQQKVLISVVYLEQFHPEDVMERVMRSICYNGIRERDVLIGVHPDNNWHLWSRRSLRRGYHPLRVPNSTYLSDEVRTIFYEKTPLTRSAQSAFSTQQAADAAAVVSTKSSEKFLHFDENNCAETALCLKWLIETVGIENPSDAEYYLPHMVDMRINARHHAVEGYSKEDLKDYPDCMIENTDQCADGHLSRINEMLAGTWELDSTIERALQPRQQLQRAIAEVEPAAVASTSSGHHHHHHHRDRAVEHFKEFINSSPSTTMSSGSADFMSMHAPPSPPHRQLTSSDEELLSQAPTLGKRHYSAAAADDRRHHQERALKTNTAPRSALHQDLRPQRFF